MKKLCLRILVFTLIFSLFGSYTLAQEELSQDLVSLESKEEVLEGKVTAVLEEGYFTPQETDKEQLYQKLEILVYKGSLKDKKIIVENGNLPMVNIQKYKVGDLVVINYNKDFEGKGVFLYHRLC